MLLLSLFTSLTITPQCRMERHFHFNMMRRGRWGILGSQDSGNAPSSPVLLLTLAQALGQQHSLAVFLADPPLWTEE